MSLCYKVPSVSEMANMNLSYVTNLDPWSTLAIVSTIPSSQVRYLRDFIYRHISLKTFIGAHISVSYPSLWDIDTRGSTNQFQPSGFRTFALEFHLPFYAWRRSEYAITDLRRKFNGRPLRRCRSLAFLNRLSAELTMFDIDGYIYEAQISCLVTGIDNYSWIGYAFVDTYFKGPDNNECVEYYDTTAKGMDPLTMGRYDANRPVWTPREYFVRVLQCRMDQVRQEWNNTVSGLLQGIEPHVSVISTLTDTSAPETLG